MHPNTPPHPLGQIIDIVLHSEALLEEDDGAPVEAMTDATAEGLVEGAEGLGFVPGVAIENLFGVGVGVVVLPLQDDLLVLATIQRLGSTLSLGVQGRVGNTYGDDGSAVVISQIQALTYLAAIDCKEESPIDPGLSSNCPSFTVCNTLVEPLHQSFKLLGSALLWFYARG